MNATSLTTGGTAVFSPSVEEFDAFVEAEVHASLGMSVTSFVEAYRAKSISHSDPIVSDVAALVAISSAGHQLTT